MNDKKLSEMSEQELRHEIQTYNEKMRKAEMNGIMNEYDVYQSKVIIAESYLVDRTKVVLGRMYKLNGDIELIVRPLKKDCHSLY